MVPENIKDMLKNNARNPLNRYKPSKYNLEYSESTIGCWARIVLYLNIIDERIDIFSFTWDAGIVTVGLLNTISDMIDGKIVDEVLDTWKWNFVQEYVDAIGWNKDDEIKFCFVLARNALHKFLEDGIMEDIDEIC